MTTLKIMLSTVWLVLIGSAVTAQTIRTSSDPGVSVHNYKHPHKARQAARLATDHPSAIPATGQTNTPVDLRQTARNYKAGNQPKGVSDALLVLPGREMEYAANPLMAKNNYKRRHRPAVPAKVPAPAAPVEELVKGEKEATTRPD